MSCSHQLERGIRSFERLGIREVQYTKKSNCCMLSSPSDQGLMMLATLRTCLQKNQCMKQFNLNIERTIILVQRLMNSIGKNCLCMVTNLIASVSLSLPANYQVTHIAILCMYMANIKNLKTWSVKLLYIVCVSVVNHQVHV